MSTKEMQKTIKMLKKMPLFKQLKRENKELIERVRSLEYAVTYLESKNAKLEKKLNKKQVPMKMEPTNYGFIDLTQDDDNEVIEEELMKNALDELLAKYPDYQNHKEVKDVVEEIVDKVAIHDEIVIEIEEVEEELEEIVDKEELEEVEEEVEVEVEVEEEEVEVEVEEEEEEVEVEEEEVEVEEVEVEEEEVEVEEEEVEEEEVEEEEVEVEEEEVEVEEVEVEVEEEEEEEEEVEVEEEEVEEEEVEVEEEEEEVEAEAEEEDVYEIQINGKTYYVTNEIDSVIYEADDEGEITIEAGAYKNGKPVFN